MSNRYGPYPEEIINSFGGEWTRENVGMVTGIISLVSTVMIPLIILFRNSKFDWSNWMFNLWTIISFYGFFWLECYLGTIFPKEQEPWWTKLLIFITWLLLRISGAFSAIPILLTTFIVLALPFAGVLWLIEKVKTLKTIIKRNWRKSKEDLPTVRKWKNACKYPKWTGILVAIVGGALAIYQSVSGGWLATSGAVLGATSELTKKRLEKLENKLVAQQSLIANPAETRQEEIELGEVVSI